LGIAAALMRDRQLARLTNICGTTRRDLYGHVAEKLSALLERDLHAGPLKHGGWAEFWLGAGRRSHDHQGAGDEHLLRQPVHGPR
jgi:hypothetical protein